MSEVVLVFEPEGNGHGLYTEAVDLHAIGRLQIERATNVEFDGETQRWQVRDRSGTAMFDSPSRQTCLDWEREHFNRLAG